VPARSDTRRRVVSGNRAAAALLPDRVVVDIVGVGFHDPAWIAVALTDVLR
jgi:hypothetical protein